MANEMFTCKSGRQIGVPVLSVPKHITTELMRLQEDYEARNEHLSLLGVLLDVIDKGKRQVRNQWKNGDLGKNRRDFAKAIAPFMRDPAAFAADISRLALKYGMVAGTAVDLSTPTTDDDIELTDEQLEQATSPDGVA